AALTLPLVARGAALLVSGVGQGPVAAGALPASYGTGTATAGCAVPNPPEATVPQAETADPELR
ncbi:hypothetical protein ACFQZ2_19550, partial [Streptomonospora algeriensis]